MDKLTVYERILLYLYDRQDIKGFVNLFNDDLKDIDKGAIREKARELEKVGRIEIKTQGPLGVSFTRQRRSEYRRWKNENKFEAKIKLSGVEYIKGLNKLNDIKYAKIEVTGQVGNLNTGNIHGGLKQSTSMGGQSADMIKPISTWTVIKSIFWILGAIVTIYALYQILF